MRSGRPTPRPTIRILLFVAGLAVVMLPVQTNSFGQRPHESTTIATFAAEVTPPLGHPLCGGTIKPVEGVDDPELAKGIILRDAGGTYVLCAVDWCVLSNEAYDLFRKKLAEAAGTSVSRVALQTVHQHDALISDVAAQKLLDQYPGAPKHLDLNWYDEVTSKVAEAVKAAMGGAKLRQDATAAKPEENGSPNQSRARKQATEGDDAGTAPNNAVKQGDGNSGVGDGSPTLPYGRGSAKRGSDKGGHDGSWRTVTRIGVSKAKVDRVASSRRVKGPDGKIQVRWSATKEAEVRAAPEGYIDPWLRTITFADDKGPVAQLHYYATHPQSYYGNGRPTWDVPGIARERLEKETAVFQIYFSGCAGDVTMGKYNDGAHELRQELAGRLHAAMKESISDIEYQPAAAIEWKTLNVEFPLLNDTRMDEPTLRKTLADPRAGARARLDAAQAVAWIERTKSKRPIELSLLSIGSIRILHLPGEPFVTFQLFAQQLRPDDFVAVAGYGEGGMGYICTEESYAEGGYEPSASNIAPESERIFRNAIMQLLTSQTGETTP